MLLTNSEKLRQNLMKLWGEVTKTKIYKKEIKKIVFHKFEKT